jgi:hypothetical protein
MLVLKRIKYEKSTYTVEHKKVKLCKSEDIKRRGRVKTAHRVDPCLNINRGEFCEFTLLVQFLRSRVRN